MASSLFSSLCRRRKSVLPANNADAARSSVADNAVDSDPPDHILCNVFFTRVSPSANQFALPMPARSSSNVDDLRRVSEAPPVISMSAPITSPSPSFSSFPSQPRRQRLQQPVPLLKRKAMKTKRNAIGSITINAPARYVVVDFHHGEFMPSSLNSTIVSDSVVASPRF